MLAREKALEAITAERFDVVVIGGGVTGAGVALDAASRGYSVAIVERHDWAIGTSSRSSKMVHGGLRYLENFDLGLVREALLERQLMVQLAPHLVYPTPFLVPAFGEERLLAQPRDRAQHVRRDGVDPGRPGPPRPRGAGGGRRLLGARPPPGDQRRGGDRAGHRRWGRLEPSGAYLFYDCQTDDVRLVLTILGEAERFGALCLNRAEVTGLREEDGIARGVLCRDGESGLEFEVEAESVINATGVWADRIRPEEIHDEAEVPRISPSRGTHLTLPAGEARPGACGADRARRLGAADLRPPVVRAGTCGDDRQRLRR